MIRKKYEKVVVTGMGAVTPVGVGVPALWDALLHGRSGVDTIKAFDASGFPTDFGGEAPDVDVEEYLTGDCRRLRKYFGKKEALALAAAREAMDQAGLGRGAGEPSRFGVAVGTEAGRPALEEVADAFVRHTREGVDPFDELDPLALLKGGPNLVASLLAQIFEARGPNVTVSTACTSSGQALGVAYDKIRNGYADVILAGGADVLVEPFMLAGFSLLGALSTRKDSPATASRPFDGSRDGFVLADGAGFLVLEEKRHAQRRGARILAEIVGYGSSLNAYRITDSPPDGSGALESMAAALEDAGLQPGDLDWINAHGTSTPMNDSSEARAIERLYAGCPMGPPPVTSFKAVLGHLVAACGVVEAIGCVEALRRRVLPPTANIRTLDPGIHLDVVPEGPRPAAMERVLTNSFGFGGSNASLVIKRVAGR